MADDLDELGAMASRYHSPAPLKRSKKKSGSYAPIIVTVGAVVIAGVLFIASRWTPAPAPVSPSPAPAAAVERETVAARPTGTISGAVVISRKLEAAQLPKGLLIELVAPKVKGMALARCLKIEAAAWTQAARESDKAGADEKKRSPDSDLPQVYEKDARDDDSHAASAIADAAKAPAEMLTINAYELVKSHAFQNIPPAEDLFKLKSAATRTDTTGNYALDHVAPGDYCLHAIYSARGLTIEWCLPVHLADGESAKLNLYNENAAMIHGANP